LFAFDREAIVKSIFAATMMVACLAGSPALAAVPPQLLNKTVTVSFTVSVPARTADGQTMTASRAVSKVIYISGAGRIFAETSRRAGRNSERVERGPEVTGSSFRSDGNRLVGTIAVGSGASQLTITFDGGFQSCTAQLLTGGQAGRPITWKGLDGVMRTSTGPATHSSPSCSIQAGNAFAGR
jgi:hypothetical protein